MSAVRKFPWLDTLQYARDYFTHIDHFQNYTTAGFWTTVTSGAGSPTVAVGDAANGIVTFTTGADNGEAYLKSTNELFLFADTRIIYGAAKVKFSQAATNQMGFIFGFMDAVASGAMVADAGPKISFSGAVFYTKPGNTFWSLCVSDGATQTLKDTGITAGGSAFQVLEVTCECVGTQLTVTFKIDGKVATDANGADVGKIVTTFANATEMAAVIGHRQGGATAEVSTSDIVQLGQSII